MRVRPWSSAGKEIDIGMGAVTGTGTTGTVITATVTGMATIAGRNTDTVTGTDTAMVMATDMVAGIERAGPVWLPSRQI